MNLSMIKKMLGQGPMPPLGPSPKPPPGGQKPPMPPLGPSPKPSPRTYGTYPPPGVLSPASDSFYTYGRSDPRNNSGAVAATVPGPGAVPGGNNASGSPAGLLARLGGAGYGPQPGRAGRLQAPRGRATPSAGNGLLGRLAGSMGAFAEGGAPRAAGPVSGPGTGRSDEIDARLSDGEYVLDAETVALLGDGSTEAGVRKLDAMRKRLRAHKGQALARGKFSPDALEPEQYLEEE